MPIMEVSEHEKMMLLGWRGALQTAREETVEIIEETNHAHRMKIRFTKTELAKRWGCSKDKVSKILKEYRVKPIDKRGSEQEFDIEQAEEAKRAYNGEALHKHEVNWEMRAIK